MVLITLCVWTGEGGVEDLFQLINRDTISLHSASLALYLSPIAFALRLSH